MFVGRIAHMMQRLAPLYCMRYIEMGYTAAFEPAILAINARQAHLEMGDTPMIDKGGYAMLGNDDYLLRMLANKADQKAINDYVAWTLHATQPLVLKWWTQVGLMPLNSIKDV